MFFRPLLDYLDVCLYILNSRCQCYWLKCDLKTTTSERCHRSIAKSSKLRNLLIASNGWRYRHCQPVFESAFLSTL